MKTLRPSGENAAATALLMFRGVVPDALEVVVGVPVVVDDVPVVAVDVVVVVLTT